MRFLTEPGPGRRCGTTRSMQRAPRGRMPRSRTVAVEAKRRCRDWPMSRRRSRASARPDVRRRKVDVRRDAVRVRVERSTGRRKRPVLTIIRSLHLGGARRSREPRAGARALTSPYRAAARTPSRGAVGRVVLMPMLIRSLHSRSTPQSGEPMRAAERAPPSPYRAARAAGPEGEVFALSAEILAHAARSDEGRRSPSRRSGGSIRRVFTLCIVAAGRILT